MRTSNPTLNDRTFAGQRAAGATMTIKGVSQKTLALLFLVFCSGAYTWDLATRNAGSAMPFALGGAIGGLILCFATVFRPQWSAITAPLYALAEGLFVGAISALYAQKFNGIVLQAVGITFGTALTMMLCYQTGLIKASEKFKIGIVAATGGICLLYIATWILSMFHVNVSFLSASTPLGIGISAVIVVIAALNLILDFDLIENGVRMGAPKYMEWYGGFALLVTLIWLYFELLRLLAKLNNRR